MTAEAYLSRGVSPTKDDVKKAVAGQSRGLFPGAFCKLVPDMAGDDAYCSPSTPTAPEPRPPRPT
jgi:phosphoribosylformylglycinamidine cyclo-ligase